MDKILFKLLNMKEVHSESDAHGSYGKDAGSNIQEKGHWVINSTKSDKSKESVFSRKRTLLYW